MDYGNYSTEPIPMSLIGPTDLNEAEEHAPDPIPICLVGPIDYNEAIVDVDAELITAEPTTYTVKIELLTEDDVENDVTDEDVIVVLDEPTGIDEGPEVTIPHDNTPSPPPIYLTSKGNTSKLKRSLHCSKCPKRFYKQVYLDAHMRGVHMGLKKSFMCPKCPKAFTTYNMLCIHTEGHHSEMDNSEHNYAMTPSTECSKSHIKHKKQEVSARQTSYHKKVENGKLDNKLQTHSQSSTPAPKVRLIRYQCSQCSKSYAHYSLLCQHKKRRHSNLETSQRRRANDGHLQYSRFVERTPNNEHRCPVCLGKFRTGNYLRKHMRRHANDIDKFRCAKCDKNFRGKSGLTRHIKVVHEGEKRFSCSYCELRFSTRQTRIFHERRHTGERPYKCDLCPKSYVEKQSFRKHMQRHETISLSIKMKCPSKRSEISNKTNI